MNATRILAPLIVAALLFTACSAKQQLKYSMTVNAPTGGEVLYLIGATERVMKRRIAALGVQTPTVIAVPTGGSGGTLTIDVPDAKLVERVRQILAEQFTFEMQLEINALPAGENVEENWAPTGIGNAHLQGVKVIGDAKTGEIGVELQFTPDGRALLEKAFRKNEGKMVGVFVRGLLVSKLKIQSASLKEHVIISGIPSATVAQIFADDVNVGLHVAFTPSEQ